MLSNSSLFRVSSPSKNTPLTPLLHMKSPDFGIKQEASPNSDPFIPLRYSNPAMENIGSPKKVSINSYWPIFEHLEKVIE